MADDTRCSPPPSWKDEMLGMFNTFKQEITNQIQEQLGPVDDSDSEHSVSSGEKDRDSSQVNNLLDDYVGNTTSGFDNLADEFSTSDKTGPAVDSNLATMVEELVKEKLPKSKLDDLMSKYLRPENCKLLVSPKVNRAVWNQLSQNTKATDRAFQKSQQYFITAMYAMMSACEKATGEMKSVLAHSLVLALAGNPELNLSRQRSSSSSRDGRAYGSRSFLGERGSYRRRGGARQRTQTDKESRQ
ncbi:uncharacterized protein LOC116286708 [Actinia tenebrosa]|uniref:Uncharacterized protein LOC116286708 n=1 Tax=Actinia tenebrosa TaxID=6105 RepID=A0A6P8GXZ2_ACTTE|nr:uncharacterized protein LOC116286708 [Actinia tenebrosa]